jgi:uncharacterized membrane-anchored protein YitT (DUF2179 family)
MSDKTLKMIGDVLYITVLTLHYGVFFLLISIDSYIVAALVLALTVTFVTSRDKHIEKITTVTNKIEELESKIKNDQNI